MHMLNKKFQNMKSTKSIFFYSYFLEDNCKEECISYKKKRYVFPSCSGAYVSFSTSLLPHFPGEGSASLTVGMHNTIFSAGKGVSLVGVSLVDILVISVISQCVFSNPCGLMDQFLSRPYGWFTF